MFKVSSLSSSPNDVPYSASTVVQTLPLQKFLNLIDKEEIKKYISIDFHSDKQIEKAIVLAKQTYEGSVREAKSPQYGLVFPMYPELLGYIMQRGNKGSVLEIAGADGLNSLLLAFSGINKVYYNDIDEKEVALCKTAIQNFLPQEVASKVEILPGDCFKVLKEPLKNKIDVILCRNLLHFFKASQVKEFFSLTKMLLKSGGEAIFTVNCADSYKDISEILQKNPRAHTFTSIECMVREYKTDGSFGKCITIYQKFIEGKEDDSDFLYHTLLKKTEWTGNTWKTNQKDCELLEQKTGETAHAILANISNHFNEIKQMKSADVIVMYNKVSIYTQETLSILLQDHGFEILSIFKVSEIGHIVLNEHFANEKSTSGMQVGAIVRGR